VRSVVVDSCGRVYHLAGSLLAATLAVRYGRCHDRIVAGGERNDMTRRARAAKWAGGVVAITFALSVQSCGGSASGCDDLHPEGPALAVGESTEIAVRIEGGGWSEAEAAGMYWAATEAVPDGAPEDGTLQGTATRTSEFELLIDFGELGTVPFTGPVTCE
jgi:hypothetical protein